MSFSYAFNYIIIGDAGVGKSCLMMQFTDNKFQRGHTVSIGIEYDCKLVQIYGQNIKVQIWDTAGHESFRTITRCYYRGSACALLVYDITNRKTFKHLANWLQSTLDNTTPGMPIILVGNKADLEDERCVSFEEGQRFARVNDLLFIEVSAKTAYNVEAAFISLGEVVLDKVTKGEIDVSLGQFGVKLGTQLTHKRKGCCSS